MRKKVNQYTTQVIVLDLDETLVHSLDDKLWFGIRNEARAKGNKELLSRMYEIDVEGETIRGIVRDHASVFIEFIYNRFTIRGVYSAGVPSYVNAIVKVLFGDRHLDFIFARDRCMNTLIDNDVMLSKPLDLIYSSVPGANRYNTWIIDDRQDTAMHNKLNHIHIPEYDPMKGADNYLKYLIDFLSKPEVMYAPNVQTVVHSRSVVFGITRTTIF